MSKRYLFIAACALVLIGLIGVVVAATPSPTPTSVTQYHYLTRWGCLGTGDGQFEIPGDIVVDDAGNIFVAEGTVIYEDGPHGNKRIQKFALGRDLHHEVGDRGGDMPGRRPCGDPLPHRGREDQALHLERHSHLDVGPVRDRSRPGPHRGGRRRDRLRALVRHGQRAQDRCKRYPHQDMDDARGVFQSRGYRSRQGRDRLRGRHGVRDPEVHTGGRLYHDNRVVLPVPHHLRRRRRLLAGPQARRLEVHVVGRPHHGAPRRGPGPECRRTGGRRRRERLRDTVR